MKTICCIDAKSFYASCECVYRGLDPFTTPLVVADESRGKGAIVLAITPYLKKIGLDSRCRIRDLPKNQNVIIAKPRMKKYLETSMDIVNIYLDYISAEDIFIYSVDEAFIDLTSYLALYHTTPYKIVKALQNKVYEKTGISVSIGVGENMIMAKFAMDIEAKKNRDSIAIWNKEDVENKLWEINDLQKLWGIGRGLKKRLNDIGIRTVRQLAHTDIAVLEKYLGKVGKKVYDLANGEDDTIISKDISYKLPKSIGNSQMLHKDIDSSNASLLFREMIEVITLKLRVNNYIARSIHVMVRYSFDEGIKTFSKSLTLDYPTDDSKVFIELVCDLVERKLDPGLIRQVGISVGHIERKECIQLDLFNDYDKNSKKEESILEIKKRFGKNSISFATSKLSESTAEYRNKLVGGHNGEYNEQ
ncbi:MAG: DNA polymerase thumb domain-containing protein [Bacilli bacterium]